MKAFAILLVGCTGKTPPQSVARIGALVQDGATIEVGPPDSAGIGYRAVRAKN